MSTTTNSEQTVKQLTPPAFPSRLPNVGTTIFTVMSALAAEHQAVNLGQGFPDFACDPALTDAVTRAMQAGHNQYPPMAGIPGLRQAIATKIEALHARQYDANAEITITAGATQAILTAILACVQPGDEVKVSITGLGTLKGFQIGVQSGDACIHQLANHGITTIVEYPNYTALLDAARRQEIKLFCLDEYPANFYLYKTHTQNDFRKAFELYQGQFRRATRKGDSETLRRVEEGMRLILPEEDAALRKKWFGTPLDIGAYGRYIGWGLTVAAGAALLLAVLSMALRRQVALKTQTLNAAMAELREAHAATSEAEHSLAATLQAIPDMLFEFDAAGHYMNVFSSRDDLLIASRSQLIGKHVSEVMPAPAASVVVDAIQAAAASGQDYGRTVGLADGEHDQGQHDAGEDVLGTDVRGILVRADAWRRLGGIDRALAGADEGLDLGRGAESLNLEPPPISPEGLGKAGLVAGEGFAGLGRKAAFQVGLVAAGPGKVMPRVALHHVHHPVVEHAVGAPALIDHAAQQMTVQPGRQRLGGELAGVAGQHVDQRRLAYGEVQRHRETALATQHERQ